MRSDRLKVVLVIIQFSIIIFLFSVLSVLVIQTRMMELGDSGFQRTDLYVFHEPFELIRKDFTPASVDISSLPGVRSVCASLAIPGHNPVLQNVWVEGDVEKNAIIITEDRVKHNYTETYRFELKGI